MLTEISRKYSTLQSDATTPGTIETIGYVTAEDRTFDAAKKNACAVPHKIPDANEGRAISGLICGLFLLKKTCIF